MSSGLHAFWDATETVESVNVVLKVSFMSSSRMKRGWKLMHDSTRTMWLTIQLVMPVALPRPMDPISTETRTVRHSRVLIVSPDEKHLPTLASLLPPPLSAEAIVFVLPFHQAQTQPPPAKPPGKAFFPPLAPTRPLEHALKGTAWVEFPIIHVIPLVEWDEAVHKGEITIMSLYEPMLEEPAERPRDNGWGSKRRASLGESGPAREPVTKKVKMAPDLGLAALGEYKSADEENESADEENESEDGEKGEKMEVSKKRKEARVDGKDGVADGKVGLVHEESEVEDVDVHLNDDVDLHREDIRLDDGFGLEYGPRELGDDENGGGNDDADGLEVGEDGLIED